MNGHWEKDIIWDVDDVEELPEPKVLELDPNDDNIILCIPDDVVRTPKYTKVNKISLN